MTVLEYNERRKQSIEKLIKIYGSEKVNLLLYKILEGFIESEFDSDCDPIEMVEKWVHEEACKV